MNALQTEITCPHMHDECNEAECPQHATCEHLQRELSPLDKAIITTKDYRHIIALLQEVLEVCQDVPGGVLSVLALLNADMENTVNLLCELKASETA